MVQMLKELNKMWRIKVCDPSLFFFLLETLSMLGDQSNSYNNEEFPDLTMFPSFSE